MNKIIRRDNGVVEIHMNGGFATIVDEEGYELVKNMAIYANRNNSGRTVYAYIRHAGTGERKALHRFLMGDPAGILIDHINGDRLDNRRRNLRRVTHRENSANGPKKRKSTSSKYKGVSLHKVSGKWRAYLASRCIGIFETEVEAAKAYDQEAKRIYREHAGLNFPEGPPKAVL